MAAMASPVKKALDSLQADSKHFLACSYQLVYDKTKENMRGLFSLLDRDGNGHLDENDFKVPVAAAQPHLDHIWRIIQENFDFDGDKVIQQKEFFDAFILMSWTKIHSSARKTVPGTIGDEFSEWVQRFNDELMIQMTLLHNVMQGGSGTKHVVDQDMEEEGVGKKKKDDTEIF